MTFFKILTSQIKIQPYSDSEAEFLFEKLRMFVDPDLGPNCIHGYPKRA